MPKYFFGSLELITNQHDDKGHLSPTATKAVKGWQTLAMTNAPAIAEHKEEGILEWIKEKFMELARLFGAMEAKLPPTERQLLKEERDRLAETWWADAEIWWKGQQVNLDLKGKVVDDRENDYQPIRETGDYQLRITGPVELPEPVKPVEKKGGSK